jgi:hypothetical protein
MTDRKPIQESIVVVSGLPRSGTSMMMRMLHHGGLEPVQDGIRRPNDDNPKGYYEFERVKKLPEKDHGWLPEARGKVVKCISELLFHLPADYDYRVVFMIRNLPEVLASQKKMLVNRGQDADAIGDRELSLLYMKHLTKVKKFLAESDHLDTHYVSYNELLREPEPLMEPLNRFLGGGLDTGEMLKVIDPDLYRQRRGS